MSGAALHTDFLNMLRSIVQPLNCSLVLNVL
jgi:hypothetical protein